MALKRKVRKAHKEISETQEQEKLEALRVEKYIKRNGDLVAQLLDSEPWVEVALPLLKEMISSVTGRFTNGRFYHGDLTRSQTDKQYLTGYQRALTDFHNNLMDFVDAKEKIRQKKREEEAEKKAQVYNPYLDELERPYHAETQDW